MNENFSTPALKVAFIINPKAGRKAKNNIEELIKTNIPANIDYEFIHWEYPKQKKEIRRLIREKQLNIAVAVGGDGTVNQVARAVQNSDTALAIIPTGS